MEFIDLKTQYRKDPPPAPSARSRTAIERYAFIGAGAVVTKDVPDFALILGNPGRQKGWMSRHGHVLKDPDDDGVMSPESGYRYRLQDSGFRYQLKKRCLELPRSG